MNNLKELMDNYPFYIPIAAAAEFLHIRPEALRASIDQGRCPFGFSWRLGDRNGYKIPTFTFLAWYAKGTFSPAS